MIPIQKIQTPGWIKKIKYFSDYNQQSFPTKIFNEDGGIFQGEEDKQNKKCNGFKWELKADGTYDKFKRSNIDLDDE